MKRFLVLLAVGLTALGGCAKEAPRSEGAHAGHQSAAPQAGERVTPDVHLDARQAVLANVATAKVSRRAATSTVTAAGRVTYDERRLARVTAWVDGRVDRLRVATTGAFIRRGQPIADLYSPDLVSTQQELLLAASSARELAGSDVPGVAKDAERLVAASRKRLRLWGLSEAQISQVLRSQRPIESLPVLSPASGVVLRRMVQAGDWVDKGMTLFEVADLSQVWVEADVYEYELAGLRPGQTVTVETVAYPGRRFTGRVAFVEPVMKAETRTNTVRIELANSQGLLKPDMFVTAHLRTDRGPRLMVPADAVVDTGKRQLIWVEENPGHFVAREVRAGESSDTGIEIVSGLKEGETIAVSGGFMIDATSQLQRGGAAGHSGHGAQPAKPAEAQASPPNGHAGHGE